MCRHEAKCIKYIVDAISSRLSQLVTNVNEDLIGIETRLLDLKLKLEIGSVGVRMVGIWGGGGSGKTTIASAAYMEISHQFEAHCFLENIRDESSKHGLKGLQQNFLSQALKIDVSVRNEIVGKSMIKSRLCHKAVLVILDDVDNLNQLDALVGSRDWFGEGSRIIITTRDEHLLSRKADAVYEVNLLSRAEAIKLFRRHAYRENKPVENYERLSLDVVSYASGLPLALKVLGSFLYDKDKDEWMSALAKLKSIPDQEIMKTLKISYDGLKHDEQELFLDIACFLRNWQIHKAMRVLDTFGYHHVIGVKVLTQKSLIKVSNGRIEMHDLIEEMAHYIVRENHPNHPEKHSRIWLNKDVLEFCATRGETLMESNHIEVLALSSEVNHPHLPDVVANMKRLRWLCLRGFPSSSLPANFQPTKLGFLELRNSKQIQLWQGYKDLLNLKVLDLSYSEYLVRTPDFNGLPCLERLILKNCRGLKEIDPSIGYHGKLVFVNMTGCEELKTFPPIIRMKKLETLILSWYRQLQKFPDIQTNMDRLVNLLLDYTSIKIIPPSLGQFCTNLFALDLTGCQKLKRVEGNFHLLRRLNGLSLSGCKELNNLAEDPFNKECCLAMLSLSFSYLMNRVGSQSFHQGSSVSLKLPQFPRFIHTLSLCSCNLGDEDIPSDICEFVNLERLDLMGNNFSRLHSSLSRIPHLKFLNLAACRRLVELPDLPPSIAVLKATQCDSLESVGDLSQYKWLWKVSLWRSNKLIGDERILHSLLQVNAVEDRFMSVKLPVESLPFAYPDTRTFALQLPHNWCSDFSGFLLCGNVYQTMGECIVVIKPEMPSIDSQHDHDHSKQFDKNHVSYELAQVGYVPFASLRHTPWWNSAYTNISFQIRGSGDFKVRLVPKKSKSDDSKERVLDRLEFLDKEMEYNKTFKIDGLNPSGIKIVWDH